MDYQQDSIVVEASCHSVWNIKQEGSNSESADIDVQLAGPP